MTQKELARRVNVNPSYISYIETGVKSLSLELFITICNELDASADDILVGNLNRKSRAFDKEVISLFSDCSDIEMQLLLETLRSTKKALREYDSTKQEKKRPYRKYANTVENK